LGYRAPTIEESFDNPRGHNSVWENDLAQAGSQRLTTELNAFHDTPRTTTDGQPIPPHIAVVAHSYGTTMAADALTETKHNVASVVFVGSAGIDQNAVRNASVLHITGGAKGLFMTHASDDHVAPTGIDLSGRADPMPGSVLNFVDHGQFGGNTFSSDGVTHSDGTPWLRATTGHDMNGVGGDGFAGTSLFKPATAGQGYFDPGTESLRNIAAAATGQTSYLVGPHPYSPPLWN